MRKRRILSLLLAVAIMATMLVAVPLTASAADDPDAEAMKGMSTISSTTELVMSNDAYSKFGTDKSTGLSSDMLLYAHGPEGKSGSIHVDGQEYAGSLGVKQANTGSQRWIAIKVAAGAKVEV